MPAILALTVRARLAVLPADNSRVAAVTRELPLWTASPPGITVWVYQGRSAPLCGVSGGTPGASAHVEGQMSSFVYGLVTSKRMAAPAGQSQKDAAPAMTTYVDTLAALVPAEALALYSAVVIPNATKTVSVHGKAETVISSPGLLGWSCGGLMLLSGALYLAGRYKSAKLTHWDIVRFLIPPTALAAWMLVQNPGVFNVWWPGSAIGERVVIAAFGAVILGILAKSLGYQADMAQAEPRASVPAQAVPAHAEPADAVAAHAEPADAVAAHAEPADAVAAHAEPAGQQVIDHGPQTVLMID